MAPKTNVEIDLGTEVTGPLLASGKATDEGETVAIRYREIKDLIDVLEEEKTALRDLILTAAAEFPGIKSFPAGDLIIRIGATNRETVPLAKIRTNDRDLYDALVAAGYVNKTSSQTLSVR